jgi:hypothetical protein
VPKQPVIPILGNPVRLTFWIETPTKVIQEVNWSNYAGDITNPAFINQAQALANLRAACMPSGVSLLQWEGSQENVWRDAIDSGGTLFVEGIKTETENLGNDNLPVLMYAAVTQYRRTQFLCGIPDTNVTSDQYAPAAPGGFNTNVNRYLTALASINSAVPPPVTPPPGNTTWGYLPILINDPRVPLCNIMTFTFTTGQTLWTITTNVAHQCSVGDVVRVSAVQGVNKQFPLNQLWMVNSVPNATSLTLQGFPPSIVPVPAPVSGGKVQKKIRIFQLYTSYSIQRPSSRNRGNRALSPIGRRKKKYNLGFPG